jgi:hypothetical protein
MDTDPRNYDLSELRGPPTESDPEVEGVERVGDDGQEPTTESAHGDARKHDPKGNDGTKTTRRTPKEATNATGVEISISGRRAYHLRAIRRGSTSGIERWEPTDTGDSSRSSARSAASPRNPT